MSLTQIINLRETELTDRIAQLANLDDEISVTYRGVYAKTNDTWSMLMGVIRMNDHSNSSNFDVCNYQYPEYQFISQQITGISLTTLISSLGENANALIPGFQQFDKKESNPNWTESLIPSHAHQEKFPIRRFSARICSDTHCHDSKLVAHGMPFYLSAFELTKDFLGLDTFHGSSDARKGELCIDIPDRRGRLLLSRGAVRFHSDMPDNLSVVGAIDGEQVKLTSQQDQYEFESEKAQNIELWLVTKDNRIVDYCSSTEWEYRYASQSNNSDLVKLLDIISAGESEHCEFKEYIDLVAKKNPKAWDIDKTVCALSNHQGGKLFIGVDDEIRIIGINDGCQRDYQDKPNVAAESYQKAVVKRLQESLNKNQCFNSHLIKYKGMFVLVIDVHKANGLNYLLNTKEAYIRRGASSARMTPAEIQSFPVEQNVLGR